MPVDAIFRSLARAGFRAAFLLVGWSLTGCRSEGGAIQPVTPVSSRHEPSPQPHDFSAAVRVAETKLGSKSSPILLRSGDAIAGGVMFSVDDGLAAIRSAHDELASLGAYLFILDRGTPAVRIDPPVDGGVATELKAEPDLLGLLPTTDKFEVIRMVGTNGNSLHTGAEVIAWLRDLDQGHPFVLVGAGVDFVEGVFLKPVQDPDALARNVYAFCPDFWDQSLGLVQKEPAETGLARYFASERYFRFWWD